MTRIFWIGLVVAVCGCGPRAIQKQPIPRADELKSIQLLGQGDQLLREGKDHLAMLKFIEASQLNPYSEHIFNMLAVTYLRLHRFQEAEKAAERAVGLNLDYSSAYNALGIARFALQDLNGAARNIRRAIRLDEDVPNYYFNLGEVLFRQEKIREARKAYQEAFELDPSLIAKATVLELPSQKPVDPEEYYQRARMWADFGRVQACIEFLRKAITAGFTDFQRLLNDSSFQRFQDDEDFQNFLRTLDLP